jgi:nucleoside-diphosphate-sugar epimerase
MRTLITGATGYIGTALARHLCTAGWDVHALLRTSSDPTRLNASVNGITCHRLTETEDGAAIALVEAVRPDCVFHLASRIQANHTATDIRPLLASNISLGVELLEGLARVNTDRQGAPSVMVTAGTHWAHDTHGEDSPNSLYAASKRAFEAFLPFYSRYCDAPGCSLLLYEVYGPNDLRGKLVPALIESALVPEGGTLAVSPGEQLLDLVYLDDVVRGLIVAAEGLRNGSTDAGRYRLDSGKRVSVKGLVAAITTVIGHAPAVEFGARPYSPNQIMVPLDTGPRLPGWAPSVSLAQGLQALVSANPKALS